ncbi:MAG TPA: DEAD/DEAH box helicase [Accumulibacter sp.]|uniref:DEAD/DEAH box helicase n=3 Tax=Accumulibacter sp. TaxID=2053492 RepID=UPI00287ABB76|nr:DEAD/DEAH box helicase [Accumulibacter sp.]MDS4055131.1 DEAD/DEAH box helicase [Accumulibacter sp.]HMV07082.1 DEAD/DEAH box helicase [Accumulibacter sp.]HNB68492.1 DEAD/DEAH box helicase [Accumulibacter sp.]HND40616.1 DEAD/DEAH box helicase [Accumulibacter sp.]HNG16933.1 DEAD/DEAH box helicase [Accumulibacter sp.]
MTFAEIGLHPALLAALADCGYSQPTSVQKQAIPAALAGNDLLVSSPTGSGKTAAFVLPALNLIASEQRPQSAKAPAHPTNTLRRGRPATRRPCTPAQPRMLVLTPTRELALQVTAASDRYAVRLRQVNAVAILGGMPYAKQMELLARNPEILVATPGRLIDHLNSGKIDFSLLRVLVLDEADRMLDMGFIEDIETIVGATPTTRQTLLFSATLEGTVGELAQRMTRCALRIRVDAVADRHEPIEQRMHFVDDQAHKNRLLDFLLRDAAIGQALVFTATRRDADLLTDRLNLAGLNAAALHGDMHQGARNRTLAAMRRGQVRILVATDVAARGIDVPAITHVFNYDLPKFAEDYVHRIGRTGRAGRSGLAISLVHHGERFNVRKIERFTRQTIPVSIVAGHEPTRQASTAPRPTGKPGWNKASKAAPGRTRPGAGRSIAAA